MTSPGIEVPFVACGYALVFVSQWVIIDLRVVGNDLWLFIRHVGSPVNYLCFRFGRGGVIVVNWRNVAAGIRYSIASVRLCTVVSYYGISELVHLILCRDGPFVQLVPVCVDENLFFFIFVVAGTGFLVGSILYLALYCGGVGKRDRLIFVVGLLFCFGWLVRRFVDRSRLSVRGILIEERTLMDAWPGCSSIFRFMGPRSHQVCHAIHEGCLFCSLLRDFVYECFLDRRGDFYNWDRVVSSVEAVHDGRGTIRLCLVNVAWWVRGCASL